MKTGYDLSVFYFCAWVNGVVRPASDCETRRHSFATGFHRGGRTLGSASHAPRAQQRGARKISRRSTGADLRPRGWLREGAAAATRPARRPAARRRGRTGPRAGRAAPRPDRSRPALPQQSPADVALRLVWSDGVVRAAMHAGECRAAGAPPAAPTAGV